MYRTSCRKSSAAADAEEEHPAAVLELSKKQAVVAAAVVRRAAGRYFYSTRRDRVIICAPKRMQFKARCQNKDAPELDSFAASNSLPDGDKVVVALEETVPLNGRLCLKMKRVPKG